MGSDIDRFQVLGPGLFLMFKFLRHMLILLVFACLFALPSFAILLQSPYYSHSPGFVRINMLRLTLASLEPEFFNAYVGLDLMATLVFLVGLIVWNEQHPRLVDECLAVCKPPSYLTVTMEKTPAYLTEQELKREIEEQLGVGIH